MKLIEKKAIVTGGASGIGKAIALAYVQEGAQVVIFDLNPEKAAQTVGEIKQATGTTVHVVICDVGSSSDVARAFQEADQALGGLDRARSSTCRKTNGT
jgi:NAD(P)-dependent dehydrogenase (short-subunit alcohol dehydrogenase family)